MDAYIQRMIQNIHAKKMIRLVSQYLLFLNTDYLSPFLSSLYTHNYLPYIAVITVEISSAAISTTLLFCRTVPVLYLYLVVILSSKATVVACSGFWCCDL
jgi:hypothetical protein